MNLRCNMYHRGFLSGMYSLCLCLTGLQLVQDKHICKPYRVVGHFPSAHECAHNCMKESGFEGMFNFGRIGETQCTDTGCRCLCVISAQCSSEEAINDYDLYKTDNSEKNLF